MRTLDTRQAELIGLIGGTNPLALVAFTLRSGLRVRRLMAHRQVAQGITLALRIAQEYCLRGDRPTRERLTRSLGYLKTCLDGIKAGEPMETVPYQVENAAVARLYDVVRLHGEKNRQRMAGMAEFAARSVLFAAELAAKDGAAEADDEDRVAQAVARDLDGALGIRKKTAIDPGPGGPFGPLWAERTGRPSWESPGEWHEDLTRIDDSEIDRLVEYADKQAKLEDILKGASLPERSDIVKSLTAISRDIEQAVAPFSGEFGRALREGLPVDQAVSILSAQVDVMHHALVGALRELLNRLHEVKNLDSREENARAVEEVYRLAKACGADLVYEGQVVSLGFVKDEVYKAGAFRVRTLHGNPKTLRTSQKFPALDLSV
mgnify:CR=1 FL=1